MSASKVRVVLDLIRDRDVDLAAEILRNTPREAATVVGKLLASAVANAIHNDGEDPEELYVSACFADEGTTLKRWRPRARGRATRIRKRTCHITVIVSRLPEERLERRRAERQAVGAHRQRRVAESRRRADLAGRLSRRRERAEAEAALEAESQVEELEIETALVQDAVAEQAAQDVVEAEAESIDAESGDAGPAGQAEAAGTDEEASGAEPVSAHDAADGASEKDE
jgi:large subunit ribosomal protein L22